MCTYKYICMHTNLYVYMYTSTYTYIYTKIFFFEIMTFFFAFIYTQKSLNLYTLTYVHKSIDLYTLTLRSRIAFPCTRCMLCFFHLITRATHIHMSQNKYMYMYIYTFICLYKWPLHKSKAISCTKWFVFERNVCMYMYSDICVWVARVMTLEKKNHFVQEEYISCTKWFFFFKKCICIQTYVYE